MTTITLAGNQTDNDILAKIKQRIDNGDTTILLTNLKAVEIPESETVYSCDIVGLKTETE